MTGSATTTAGAAPHITILKTLRRRILAQRLTFAQFALCWRRLEDEQEKWRLRFGTIKRLPKADLCADLRIDWGNARKEFGTFLRDREAGNAWHDQQIFCDGCGLLFAFDLWDRCNELGYCTLECLRDNRPDLVVPDEE